jgi:hypothetical protein
MLRTHINTALNRIVELHKPAELAVERLDFRSPDLSGRMNRLVRNRGRAVFRARLDDLKDKFGITAIGNPSLYTSQECWKCHYVDRKNRPTQSRFRCHWCGGVKHADVNAATGVASRRSAGLGGLWLTKGAVQTHLHPSGQQSILLADELLNGDRVGAAYDRVPQTPPDRRSGNSRSEAPFLRQQAHRRHAMKHGLARRD